MKKIHPGWFSSAVTLPFQTLNHKWINQTPFMMISYIFCLAWNRFRLGCFVYVIKNPQCHLSSHSSPKYIGSSSQHQAHLLLWEQEKTLKT